MTLGKKSVNNNNNVSEAGNGATGNGNGKIDQRAARGPVQNIPEYHPPYLSQLRKCDRKPETLSNKVVTHVEFIALSFYRSQNVLCRSKYFEPFKKFDCI